MRILQILRNGVIDSENDGFRHVTYQNEIIKEAIDTIDALTRERDKLAIEAKAGRELRDEIDIFDTSSTVDIPKLIKAYDTSTKGSTHEVP